MKLKGIKKASNRQTSDALPQKQVSMAEIELFRGTANQILSKSVIKRLQCQSKGFSASKNAVYQANCISINPNQKK